MTSPPYFGQRDYLTRRWFGGDPTCPHEHKIEIEPRHRGQVEQTKWRKAEGAGKGQTATTAWCSRCFGWWGQIGLEPNVEDFIEHLAEVFREVRRVLRPDGTLWVVIGDTFARSSDCSSRGDYEKRAGKRHRASLKSGDLMMIPAQLALALREDGWHLRAENIWNKPNVLPSSVKDRTTVAHEHVFMLSRSRRYLYDLDAASEDAVGGGRRNRRSVWSINTRPYPGAHHAVFPTALPEICIRAGSRPGDIVLDPFAGSGTTLAVAKKLDRAFLGVEINEAYRELIEERLREVDEERSGRIAPT